MAKAFSRSRAASSGMSATRGTTEGWASTTTVWYCQGNIVARLRLPDTTDTPLA